MLLVCGLDSCKSAKEAEGSRAAEEPTWTNVTLPVRLNITQPAKFSFNGTCTMVRGHYVLISLRMLGFEVGQIYVTPQEANVVVKQMMPMWVQEPLGARLDRLGVEFADLQEALMGNPEAIAKLPSAIGVEVKDSEVVFSASVAKVPVAVGFSWNLSEAQWDRENPPSFREPSGISKISASKAAKALGGAR